jgi:hypothetical protein
VSEERRLRVFEKRVPRRIFGPKCKEVRGEWKKLHNDEFNNLKLLSKYYFGDQLEKNEIGRVCSMYGGEESCIQGIGGKT